MAENSLSPAFVKINYASAFGSHVMTVPCVPIILAAGADPARFDLRGAALPVPVQGAVEDYVDVLKTWFPSTVTFQDYVGFAQASPTDVPVPVVAGSLGIVGTNASPGWTKAVQQTFTFKADDYTIFKVVLLDAGSFSTFDKRTDPASTPLLTALVDYVTAEVTWVASRGGGRPNSFLQNSTTLNEALRKRYNMT